MTQANDYFRSFKKSIKGELNTIAIGQIQRIDPEKMKADVVVLPENELLLNIPIGALQTGQFYIRVPYEPGDYVVIAFAQRDIDAILYGGNVTASDRMLAKDDAIIMCGLNPFILDPLPAENPLDLVIGKKNGKASIVLKDETDDIEVICEKFIVNGREL